MRGFPEQGKESIASNNAGRRWDILLAKLTLITNHHTLE